VKQVKKRNLRISSLKFAVDPQIVNMVLWTLVFKLWSVLP